MSTRAAGPVLVALVLAACACPTGRAPERVAERPMIRRTEPAPEVRREPAPVAPAACDTSERAVTLETLAPAEVNRNEPYVYKIRVVNTSTAANVTDVLVTHRLPGEGFEYESSAPAGTLAGGAVTWKLGDMRPGQVTDIAVRGRATQTGVLVSCGSVTYTPVCCASTKVVAPALALTKTAPAEVHVCDEIPLRFVVSNPGTGVAANVKVVDVLPDGWTVDGRRAVTFDVGALKVGESRELTAIAHTTRTGKFESRATATADGGLTGDASAPTSVRQPVLAISRTASAKSQVLGRDTKFTITVKNNGDAAANDLSISDSLAGAEAVTSVSDSGALSGKTGINWNFGSLAAGAERSVSFTANRTMQGALSASATAKAVCAAAVTGTAETLYAGVPAVLLEVVDDPDPVVIGSTTTYTISVTNQGTAPSTQISIVCSTDAGVQIVSTSGATPVAGAPASIRFETLDVLAPKQTAKWNVVVRAAKPGDTRFKVSMTTHETERPVEETEATRFYE